MRARNIKPSLFKNELLAVADPLHTIIFAGLWCLADREGRLEDRPARIHFDVNPGRSYEGTAASLVWLSDNGFIARYRLTEVAYIQIINFTKHQNPHCKEPPSTIPAPCEHGATTVPARLIPDSGFRIPDSPSLIPDSLRSSSSESLPISPSGRVREGKAQKARGRQEALRSALAAVPNGMPK